MPFPCIGVGAGAGAGAGQTPRVRECESPRVRECENAGMREDEKTRRRARRPQKRKRARERKRKRPRREKWSVERGEQRAESRRWNGKWKVAEGDAAQTVVYRRVYCMYRILDCTHRVQTAQDGSVGTACMYMTPRDWILLISDRVPVHGGGCAVGGVWYVVCSGWS